MAQMGGMVPCRDEEERPLGQGGIIAMGCKWNAGWYSTRSIRRLPVAGPGPASASAVVVYNTPRPPCRPGNRAA